uniref:Arginine n=1 Tax=Rostrostelium ellipticum TaxID=361140 RepID=A0A1L2FV00_9MYCE|nr:arginine [Rostrostelium ellipticum]
MRLPTPCFRPRATLTRILSGAPIRRLPPTSARGSAAPPTASLARPLASMSTGAASPSPTPASSSLPPPPRSPPSKPPPTPPPPPPPTSSARKSLAIASASSARAASPAATSEVRDDNIAKLTADQDIDAWFMALPDKVSRPYVAALDTAARSPVLVDLSSDHRFDASWAYGNPETNRARIAASRRIANPGCYATGMYLSLYPLVRAGLLDGAPSCFGVSGYSGAGSKKSEKNDPARLSDNLLPYTLTGHTHEREVGHQLGQRIFFTPHVGQFFQGITLTISIRLTRQISRDDLLALYTKQYANEPLVRVAPDAIPEVRDNANKHTVTIGGFALDGNHLVLITTLDNLLKGAATQALQNMNLCLGIDELEGIPIMAPKIALLLRFFSQIPRFSGILQPTDLIKSLHNNNNNNYKLPIFQSQRRPHPSDSSGRRVKGGSSIPREGEPSRPTM